MSSSLRLEAVYIIRHSISPIYCYYSDKDILNCHKTFTIDTMFIPFWTKLFQVHKSTILKQISLYKLTGLIHRNTGEFANYSHKHKRKKKKNLFKTSHVALILNRFFTFVFMFPSMFEIRKLLILTIRLSIIP